MCESVGDIMKSKFDLSSQFLKKDDLLICPKCKKKILLNNHSLVCENNHTFDISKKGVVTLLSTNHIKVSKIYNYALFYNRREFIKKMFYKDLYNKIVNIINDKFDREINIIDLGCGEGIHTMNILANLKMKYVYYGFDYSKIAIDMASDYNNSSRLYFVSDVNDIPIKDDSADVIIDILSPYNTKEVKRLLKKDGIFVKVAPNKNYLKELRKATDIYPYEKEVEIENNLKSNFKNINKETTMTVYPITKQEFDYLINMSPMHNETVKQIPKEITIDLIIYIMNGV